jgi:hypothetical protein
MRHALVIALVLGLGAGHATAGWEDTQGNAWLHYELSTVHDIDSQQHPRELILAGARLHGIVGTRWFGYHAGLDLAAGSTLRGGGLAYDVALFPAGVGLRFGSSFLALGVGIGAMGAVGQLDDAVTYPLDLTLEIDGGPVRLVARGRASYIAAAKGREDGARFADELEAMAGIRVGHRYTRFAPNGNGYFAGVAYREMLGERFVGAVIGYSIDVGSPNR